MKIKPTVIPAGEYYSKVQVAELRGVVHQRVQQWIDQGDLVALAIPGMGYLIDAKTLAEFKPRPRGRPPKSNSPKQIENNSGI